MSSRHVAHTTPNALRSFVGYARHSGDAHLMLPHPHTLQISVPAAFVVLVADVVPPPYYSTPSKRGPNSPISCLRALEHTDGLEACVERWTQGSHSRTIELIVSLCQRYHAEEEVDIELVRRWPSPGLR